MDEPSPRSSRIALAGGLAAALLVGGTGFLVGRVTTERTPVVVAPAPVATPAPAPPEPAPLISAGVLGRADLITLATLAADAAAAGRDPDAVLREAAGRRFELRLPFGCGGPAGEASTAAMRWRYDEESSALRLHVAPVRWSAADWWREAPSGAQAVEGFWIMRPWTSTEDCPDGDRPVPTGTEPVTLPGQTLAIGEVIPARDGAGGGRDEEPYQTVLRVPPDELDASAGFRVRVTGRIARLPDGDTVRCQQPAGPEQRPICLIGVVMDEVAIENPATGQTVATWTVAQRRGSPA